MSHRHAQLESTLKRAVQQVMARGLQDPRTNGAMITVTGLTISPDLKNATVLVSVFPEEKRKLAMHAVRHAGAHIRHEASELVAMKSIPQMVFELDTGLGKQLEVLTALRKVREEQEQKGLGRTDRSGEEGSAAGPGGGNNPPEAGQP